MGVVPGWIRCYRGVVLRGGSNLQGCSARVDPMLQGCSFKGGGSNLQGCSARVDPML